MNLLRAASVGAKTVSASSPLRASTRPAVSMRPSSVLRPTDLRPACRGPSPFLDEGMKFNWAKFSK